MITRMTREVALQLGIPAKVLKSRVWTYGRGNGKTESLWFWMGTGAIYAASIGKHEANTPAGLA